MHLPVWLHRTAPDPNRPGNVTPFRPLFGHDIPTQLDAATPTPDDENLEECTPSSLTAVKPFTKYKKSVMLCKSPQRRHTRSHRNAMIRRISNGTRVKPGDLVLVREAESVLHRGDIHSKMAPKRWAGLWTVIAIITPGLCYRVTLNGRQK